jgi:peptidylprolyl isomerase domain and WD repeat-containing protein 1
MWPGYIEYWSPDDYKAPPSSGPGAVVKFSMKLDTDLFALAKAKTYARTLEVGFNLYCYT